MFCTGALGRPMVGKGGLDGHPDLFGQYTSASCNCCRTLARAADQYAVLYAVHERCFMAQEMGIDLAKLPVRIWPVWRRVTRKRCAASWSAAGAL